MKKLLIFTLSLTLLCTAAACSNINSGQTDADPTNESTSAGVSSFTLPTDETKVSGAGTEDVDSTAENTTASDTYSFG